MQARNKDWVLAQSVQCLWLKYEGFDSIPIIHVKSLSMVMFTCNPNVREAEIGRSLELIGPQTQPPAQIQTNERLRLKK